uniref:Rab_B74 protein n=1 Tax=Paramecium tetraurelia TaxID=5888 RepID=Q3SDT8_PARTE|nr:rab_B74 [Paramecium tetraurelia]
MAQNTTSGPMQKFKIVFLGNQSVGKTSIINRFIFDNFTGNEQPTVGIDFISKTLQVDNKSVRLQLWDTAGQERFRSLIPSYIRDSQAAIICYDITNEKSFQDLQKWIEDVKDERGDEVLIYILGNKIDLDQERVIQTDVGEAKAKELGASFSEVSAKSAHNVSEFFKKLSYDLQGNPNEQQQQQQPLPQVPSQQQQPNQPIQIKPNESADDKKQGSGCC